VLLARPLKERHVGLFQQWQTRRIISQTLASVISILHECAVQGNYEAAQFLIDHGIDMTVRDYRWNATAEGWAYHAAKDKNMTEFLARAERARKAQSP
jgi:hypothetical protein